jgi:uncharacterized protein YkwD
MTIPNALSSRSKPRRCTSYAGHSAVLGAAMLAASTVFAQDNSPLISMINDYRQSPQKCDGKEARPAGPLSPEPALARVRIESGTSLQQVLKKEGFRAAQAGAVAVSGPANPEAAMNALKQRYCGVLLDPRFTAIGVSRKGNSWHVVLARPLISDDLGDWRKAGREVLQLVNAARSRPRTCGNRKFSKAPSVEWNDKLGAASLAHSRDMANQDYFQHEGKDGSDAGSRAKKEGYSWKRIGENIATGQGSPRRVVSGWLASPGHCANIMNGDFTQMGAAYAVNSKSDTAIYWTQVFGTPR